MLTSSTWVWRDGATCAWEVGFGGGNHHVGAGSRKVAGLDYGIASPHWTARPSHGNRTESWNTRHFKLKKKKSLSTMCEYTIRFCCWEKFLHHISSNMTAACPTHPTQTAQPHHLTQTHENTHSTGKPWSHEQSFWAVNNTGPQWLRHSSSCLSPTTNAGLQSQTWVVANLHPETETTPFPFPSTDTPEQGCVRVPLHCV